MKKFIATFALVATVMGMQAQSETKDFVNYERGYRADIALSTSISEQYSITTSHGSKTTTAAPAISKKALSGE